MRKPLWWQVWVLLAVCSGLAAAQQPPTEVQARKMLYPSGHAEFDSWKSYKVRTLAQLGLPAVDTADRDEDKYGGRSGPGAPATGYFYTKKVGDRWWMVDPLGHLYLHNAVVDLHPGTSDRNHAALKASFGDNAAWMQQTQQMLRDDGFTGAGAWSAADLLRASALQATAPLAYTVNLDIMASYGRHRGGTHPAVGHEGYPQDTIFVFDPEFPAYADKYLARIDVGSSDPNLVGYFSDNEIPLYRKNLDSFLSLPDTDAGHQAAAAWMKSHNATAPDDALRVAFLEFEASRYFEIVTAAIRKHDPNHMYLGCRYTSQQLQEPALFRAAGRFASAVSINYYSGWQPDAASMDMWEREAQKPFMITEFYVKGDDSGLGNTTGAGWVVRTQADRGVFYQNFVLALLESRKCVGWHWFKYQDNDPADSHTDLSNRDSNKGIVDLQYKPYVPLLAAMKALNLRMYQIADRFSQPSAAPAVKGSPAPGPKGT